MEVELDALLKEWPELPASSDRAEIIPPVGRCFVRRARGTTLEILYQSGADGVTVVSLRLIPASA